jgi:hypothetical protein
MTPLPLDTRSRTDEDSYGPAGLEVPNSHNTAVLAMDPRMTLYQKQSDSQVPEWPLNPTLNHQDTKSTKHTPDISDRALFVSS